MVKQSYLTCNNIAFSSQRDLTDPRELGGSGAWLPCWERYTSVTGKPDGKETSKQRKGD